MITRLVAALIGAALLTVTVVSVLWLVVAGATAYGLFYGGWWLWRDFHARADARRHYRAELVARAEIQHRWYLGGDPRGIYGRYPPARVVSAPHLLQEAEWDCWATPLREYPPQGSSEPTYGSVVSELTFLVSQMLLPNCGEPSRV